MNNVIMKSLTKLPKHSKAADAKMSHDNEERFIFLILLREISIKTMRLLVIGDLACMFAYLEATAHHVPTNMCAIHF